MVVLDTLSPATLLSGRYRQDEIPNLSGKTAVVTGGSAGIGYHDALSLARAGAKVLILSANPERGGTAQGEMNTWLKEHGGPDAGSVRWYQVDFSDMKAVNALAQQLGETESRLDILINNASIVQPHHEITEDGLEKQYEINDLACFILTLRLLPLMKRTVEIAPPASVRIVFQTSEIHRLAPGDTEFASVEEINVERDSTRLYGRSKLGQILLGRQLVKRALPPGPKTIIVTSVHPGTVSTGVHKYWSEAYGALGTIAELMIYLVGKSAPEGAEASLWAATCTEINEETFANYQGNYYTEAHGKALQESSSAQDEALGDAFWELAKEQAMSLLGEDVTDGISVSHSSSSI